MQQPASADTAHAQPVSLVDDEQRPVPAAHLVQLPQRSHGAVGGEHRLGVETTAK